MDDRDLAGLDEALIGVMQAMQRAPYRRLILRGVDRSVTMGTVRVLRAVERSGDDSSISEVADALILSHSATSRLIDDAVRHGYVSRTRSHQDGRRRGIRLTASGRSLLAQTDLSRRSVLSDLLVDWPDDDVQDIARLLGRLVDHLTGLQDQDPPA